MLQDPNGTEGFLPAFSTIYRNLHIENKLEGFRKDFERQARAAAAQQPGPAAAAAVRELDQARAKRYVQVEQNHAVTSTTPQEIARGVELAQKPSQGALLLEIMEGVRTRPFYGVGVAWGSHTGQDLETIQRYGQIAANVGEILAPLSGVRLPRDVERITRSGTGGQPTGSLAVDRNPARNPAGPGPLRVAPTGDPGVIERKTVLARGATREALSAAGELRVADMLTLEGNPVHFLAELPGQKNADFLVGGVRTDVKRITGLGRHAAADLAAGVRQVGPGGEVIVVRPADSKQSLSQYQDFVGKFRAKQPVTFRVVNEDALPKLQAARKQ